MKKVLIIKQSEAVRGVLVSVVEERGHQAFTPVTLLTALQLLIQARMDQEPFDLVVTGLRMPDQPDGRELLRALVENAGGSIIVIVSGGGPTPREYEDIVRFEEGASLVEVFTQATEFLLES